MNLKKIILLILLVAGFFGSAYMSDKSRPDWKKISPFTAIEIQGETIDVVVEETPYELLAIENVSTAQLIETSKKRFGRKWKKRIREDIAEVLEAAGAPSTTTVDLHLQNPETGKTIHLPEIEMTHMNRQKIYRSD